MNKYEQGLVQEYFEGCSLDWMVGTKEFPFYIIGELESKGENWAVLTYPVGVGNSFPGFITPSVTRSEFCNMIIGDTYLVGVKVKENLGEVDGTLFRYRIEWEEPIKEVVIADNDSTAT